MSAQGNSVPCPAAALAARPEEAGGESGAAFTAHEIEEFPVEPGDLLYQSNRSAYRTLAERRRQLGGGARSHCDVVVEVDPDGSRILAVGGNVLGAVTLKVFPAVGDGSRCLRPWAAPPRPPEAP